MEVLTDPKTLAKFEAYPEEVKPQMQDLRQIVLDTADELGLPKLTETLKWGEPSYLNKKGSTIRMDWKEKAPEQYSLYFICNTNLVNTFQTIYPTTFRYEGNRAMHFGLNEELPLTELKHCIGLALRYKELRDLPLLGA